MEGKKRKVVFALAILGLFLSSFILIGDAASYFVGSKESGVYHYPGYRYVDRIKSENLIYFDTPEDAIAAGYHPCKVCKPPIPSIITPTPTLTSSQTPSPVKTPVSPYVWKCSLNTSNFGESGIISRVIDGNTVEVEGIGRIRFADVNTPEIETEEGKEAKEYVKGLCYQKKVYLDIDDLFITGKYGRIVAVVYIPYNETHYVNLNQLLLKEGYAEARDYPNEFNPDDWMGPMEYVAILPSHESALAPTSSLMPSPVYPTPPPMSGFEFLFAIIGILATIYLIKRKG